MYLISSSSPLTLVCQKDSIGLWHHRLCHTSKASLLHLASADVIFCKTNKLGVSDYYCLAKSHKLPFVHSTTTASKPLELVHCDV
jgi:hypothetical protein